MKNKDNSLLLAILFVSVIFLLITIILISIQSEKNNQESYNYGCVRGCYYAVFSNETTPVFAYNNDIYVCMLKCVKDYGDWK